MSTDTPQAAKVVRINEREIEHVERIVREAIRSGFTYGARLGAIGDLMETERRTLQKAKEDADIAAFSQLVVKWARDLRVE